MGKKIKVVLNRDGVRELLKSTEMENECLRHANAIQKRCGPKYNTDTYCAGTRVIASVFTDDAAEVRETMKNNTLLKAVKGS